MVDVFLMRHSHVDYSPEVVITTRNPLTPLGHRLADLLAQRAVSWDLQHLFISTMTRAQQTAEALLRRMPDLPHTDMPGLAESHAADLEGFPGGAYADDVRTWSPEQFTYANRRLFERVSASWQRIQAVVSDEGLERVGVVAHGGSINMLLRVFQGMQSSDIWTCFFEIDWTAVTVLRYSPEWRRRYILKVNDATHIDPLRGLLDEPLRLE